MESLGRPERLEEPETGGKLQALPQVLSGIWYTEAVGSGADVISHIQHGISSGNLKTFAVSSVIAAVSSYRAIHYLTDYIDTRQTPAYEIKPAE